jgi:YHS domain-containing protein
MSEVFGRTGNCLLPGCKKKLYKHAATLRDRRGRIFFCTQKHAAAFGEAAVRSMAPGAARSIARIAASGNPAIRNLGSEQT